MKELFSKVTITIFMLSFLFMACGNPNESQDGQGRPVPALSSTKSPTMHVTAWSSVSSGYNHTCAIDANYSYPWCWGSNGSGQLGSGNTAEYITPHGVSVGGIDTWAQISAGENFTCARKTNGTVWCWGWNFYGQVGDGTTTDRWTPAEVGSSPDWVSVDAGENHVCGLLNNHTLWCWGSNQYSQIGTGSINYFEQSPVQLVKSWKSVSAGGYHTCAIKTDSSLWCWGDNENGQLGIGNTVGKSVPAKAGTATNWVAVSTGYKHTCAKKKDGTLWCWGANFVSQVGNGRISDTVKKPVQVGKANTWKSLSLGADHSCAMKKNTGLYCWGYNNHGQLCTGDTANRNKPRLVSSAGTGYLSVAAGAFHTCGLWSDANIWCWGNNQYGQLGNGNTADQTYPALVQNP